METLEILCVENMKRALYRKRVLNFVKQQSEFFPKIKIFNDTDKLSEYALYDIQWSTHLLIWKNNSNVVSFTILKCAQERIMTIVLMCSKKSGMGRVMFDFISQSDTFKQQYIIARSVVESVLFYIKMGCKIFNYIETESYITGKYDEELTEMIKIDYKKVLEIIRKRGWIPEDCLLDTEDAFFPIIYKRNTPQKTKFTAIQFNSQKL